MVEACAWLVIHYCSLVCGPRRKDKEKEEKRKVTKEETGKGRKRNEADGHMVKKYSFSLFSLFFLKDLATD